MMKKFLSLGVLVAALAVVAGCDEKKTTGGPVTKVTPTSTAGTGGAGGAGAGTGTH